MFDRHSSIRRSYIYFLCVLSHFFHSCIVRIYFFAVYVVSRIAILSYPDFTTCIDIVYTEYVYSVMYFLFVAYIRSVSFSIRRKIIYYSSFFSSIFFFYIYIYTYNDSFRRVDSI